MGAPRDVRAPGARLASAAVLVMSVLLLCVTSAQQATSLQLVSTSWTPFTNPPGQPRFALDLVDEALGRIGITATTTIVGAPQFTSSLLSGRFDGSAAAWKDPERERVLMFSEPYLENRLVLVSRYGVDVDGVAGRSEGKRVAIVEGYSYGDEIDAKGRSSCEVRAKKTAWRRCSGAVDYTLMGRTGQVVPIWPDAS